MKTLVQQLQGTFSGSGLQKLYRDLVITEGTTFLIDTGRDFSWAGSAPINGQVVKDLTYEANDADVVVSAGAISDAGGGFNFTGVTGRLKIPAAAIAPLFADQMYLVCLYVKLPSSANWNSDANDRSFLGFYGGGNAAANAGLADISTKTVSGTKRLQAGRQTSIGAYGTTSYLSGAELDPYYETVTQIAFWRTASVSSFTARFKNATTSTTKTDTASTAKNTADFSAIYGELGVAGNGSVALGANPKNFNAYRLFIEDLSVSGRNPVDVLDADWARVVARGDLS